MNRRSQGHKTTLYVDTENLGGPEQTIREKTELIARAVTGQSWPPTIPEATMIKAYCHNGEGARWEETIRAKLGRPIAQGGLVHPSPLEIAAPEVPRFGSLRKPAANAMDLTLMLETLSDLLTQRTKFAVIISNDSDYGHLLRELRKLDLNGNLDPPYDINGLPLLILTHGYAGISESYREFSENVKCIPSPEGPTSPPVNGANARPSTAGAGKPGMRSIFDHLTLSEVVQSIAAGLGYRHRNNQGNRYEFTAYDAHRAISGQHPEQAAKADEMNYAPDVFHDWFHRFVWPNMGKRGISCRKGPSGKMTYVMDQQTWLRLRQR